MAVRVEQRRKLAKVASGKRGDSEEVSGSNDPDSVGAVAGSRAPGLWRELCSFLAPSANSRLPQGVRVPSHEALCAIICHICNVA